MRIRERIDYVPCAHPATSAPATRLDQEAVITCLQLLSGYKASSSGNGILTPVIRRVEDFGHDRFRQNAVRGRDGFSMVLRSLFGRSDAPLDDFRPVTLQGESASVAT